MYVVAHKDEMLSEHELGCTQEAPAHLAPIRGYTQTCSGNRILQYHLIVAGALQVQFHMSDVIVDDVIALLSVWDTDHLSTQDSKD